MILPTKHTNFSASLLGFGAYILTKLNNPTFIEDLWSKYEEDCKNKIYYAKHSYDNFLMALVFLYSIGAITEENGTLLKCN